MRARHAEEPDDGGGEGKRNQRRERKQKPSVIPRGGFFSPREGIKRSA